MFFVSQNLKSLIFQNATQFSMNTFDEALSRLMLEQYFLDSLDFEKLIFFLKAYLPFCFDYTKDMSSHC